MLIAVCMYLNEILMKSHEFYNFYESESNKGANFKLINLVVEAIISFYGDFFS